MKKTGGKKGVKKVGKGGKKRKQEDLISFDDSSRK
jgi:hypothetical protein